MRTGLLALVFATLLAALPVGVGEPAFAAALMAAAAGVDATGGDCCGQCAEEKGCMASCSGAGLVALAAPLTPARPGGREPDGREPLRRTLAGGPEPYPPRSPSAS